MPRLLVCQHVPFEILGTLDPVFRSHGFRIRYVNFGRDPEAQPRLRGYDGLVVLGGPMSVGETDRYPHLIAEIELIRTAIDREIPVLGICLGAQLIARALGAEVRPSPRQEIGWYDLSLTEEGRRDPLFAHFEDPEKIFQWHGDTFDIPHGAVHLALSPGCPSQAFRYGSSVYGLQFHLEVDQPLIERWLTVPVHQAELARLKGRIDPQRIREQTPKYIERLKRLSDRAFVEFVHLFGVVHRKPDHPHR